VPTLSHKHPVRSSPIHSMTAEMLSCFSGRSFTCPKAPMLHLLPNKSFVAMFTATHSFDLLLQRQLESAVGCTKKQKSHPHISRSKGQIYSTTSIAIARATAAMLQGGDIQYRLYCNCKSYISYAARDRYTVPPLLQELHQLCCMGQIYSTASVARITSDMLQGPPTRMEVFSYFRCDL
jgi:hypothetical protein